MPETLGRILSNSDEWQQQWNQAIADAEKLLQKAEARAARLRGAIRTFKELRDLGTEDSGPKSAAEI